MKKLYREPNPNPREVASQIVSALDGQTRAEMAGPGVACCLSGLLGLAQRAASGELERTLTASPLPPVIALSEELRSRTERLIAQFGLTGRFTDLAVNALGTAAFEAATPGEAAIFEVPPAQANDALAAYVTGNRLHQLALCFVSHDLDHAFRHFVTRDTADFVGTPGLPRNVAASQLRDAVSVHCRNLVAQVQAAAYEATLAEALRQDETQRYEHLREPLAELTELSLRKLAVGE